MADLDSTPLTPLFSVPVLSHVWDDCEAMNEALLQAVFTQEKISPGQEKSNAGGWHSTEDLQNWTGQAGEDLLERIFEAVNHATSLLFQQNKPDSGFTWGISIWANVNRQGEHNRMHIHPGSTWSGVYYVDVGSARAEQPDSGKISFTNPILAEKTSFFPKIMPESRSMLPVNGQMLLFPSYLQHQVQTYWGERPRVTIAFNVRKDPFP